MHDPDGDGPLKPICEKRPYEGCWSAGEPDPIGHAVTKPEYCELQRWREIIDLYQAMDNVVVLGLVKTTDPAGTPRSVEAIEEDIQLYKDHVPAVRGVYVDEGGDADFNEDDDDQDGEGAEELDEDVDEEDNEEDVGGACAAGLLGTLLFALLWS
jgi:hypothetical protein